MTKPRPDSLCAKLQRLDALDGFFAFVASESPAYDAMLAWLAERGIQSSAGAIHNLIAYHMSAWRIRKASEAAQEELAALPETLSADLRRKISGLRLDLAMRDLSVEEMLALIRIDQADRSQELKAETLRLDREKFETDAARLAMRHIESIRTVMADNAIDDSERILRVRRALFGDYTLQTVTTAANMRPGQTFNELIIHNLQSPCI